MGGGEPTGEDADGYAIYQAGTVPIAVHEPRDSHDGHIFQREVCRTLMLCAECAEVLELPSLTGSCECGQL